MSKFVTPRDAARCVGNAMALIGGYDLVLDGSDNFETRYLVSDACFLAQEAADHRGARHVRRHCSPPFAAHEKNADGEFNRNLHWTVRPCFP